MNPPRIFWFTPYDDRGLGFAYNASAAILPADEDWAVFTDLDTMFFSSQLPGQQIEKAILGHPEYSAFTCVTNRLCLRCQQQLQSTLPGIREERDLVKLKQYADFRKAKFEGRIEPIRGFFAGFFMVFQKKLWKRFPFPEVGSQGGKFLGIDSAWARTLRQNRVRVGMMLGLMATHFYRLDMGETNISHLPDPTHNARAREYWSPPSPQARKSMGLTSVVAGPGQLIPSSPRDKQVFNADIRPPGGYKYRDADGMMHIGADLERLEKIVRSYRIRIGRPVGNPMEDIVNQICTRCPSCCRRG